MGIRLTTHSAEETKQLALRLAKILKPNAVICLFGDLGTGKTTFVKGLAQAWGIAEREVQSPTFVLMHKYEGKLPVYHFDLYRLEDLNEIKRLGLNDYLYDDAVAVIEWADRLKEHLPKDYIRIELEHKQEDARTIRIQGVGRDSKTYVTQLEKKYS